MKIKTSAERHDLYICKKRKKNDRKNVSNCEGDKLVYLVKTTKIKGMKEGENLTDIKEKERKYKLRIS